MLDTWWGKSYLEEPFIEKPGLWFIINIMLWALIGWLLKRVMSVLADKSQGVLTVRWRPNLQIDVQRLYVFLETKEVGEEEVGFEQSLKIRKVSWTEKRNSKRWQNFSPKLEIVFDEKFGFLLSVYVQVEKEDHKKISEEELKKLFIEELQEANVLLPVQEQKKTNK